MIVEKFLKYTKTAKKGKIVSIVAEIKPVKGCLFNLCEYNQIKKIYTAKNKAALQEIKKPNKKPEKLKKKYNLNFVDCFI